MTSSLNETQKRRFMRRAEAIAAAFSGKDNPIQIEWGQTPSTDGTTIWLPWESLEDPERTTAYILHECGHIRYTDVWPHQGQTLALKFIANGIEDARIERLVRERYPGAGYFFEPHMSEGTKNFLKGVADKNTATAWIIGCYAYMRMGANNSKELAKDLPLVKSKLVERFGQKAEELDADLVRFPWPSSAQESWDLAKALLAKFFKPESQPESQPQSNQGQGQEGSEGGESQSQGDSSEQGQDANPSDSSEQPENGQPSDQGQPSDSSESSDSGESSESSSGQDSGAEDSADAEDANSQSGGSGQSDDSSESSDDQANSSASSGSACGQESGEDSEGEAESESGSGSGSGQGSGDTNGSGQDSSPTPGYSGNPKYDIGMSDADIEGKSQQADAEISFPIHMPDSPFDWSDDALGESYAKARGAKMNKAEKAIEIRDGNRYLKEGKQLLQAAKGKSAMFSRSIIRLIEGQKHHWCRTSQNGRKIDTKRIARLGVGDTRVFTRSGEVKGVETAVVILMDRSGSMMGEQMEMAHQAAIALLLALRRASGCKSSVACFPTYEDDWSWVVKFDQEPQKCLERIGFAANANGGSPFEKAFKGCCRELANRPEPRKIVIALTDGFFDVTSASEFAKAKGIEVGVIGIGKVCLPTLELFEAHALADDPASISEALQQVTKKLQPCV